MLTNDKLPGTTGRRHWASLRMPAENEAACFSEPWIGTTQATAPNVSACYPNLSREESKLFSYWLPGTDMKVILQRGRMMEGDLCRSVHLFKTPEQRHFLSRLRVQPVGGLPPRTSLAPLCWPACVLLDDGPVSSLKLACPELFLALRMAGVGSGDDTQVACLGTHQLRQA